MGSNPSWPTWKCDLWHLRPTISTMSLRCDGTAEPTSKYLYCKHTIKKIRITSRMSTHVVRIVGTSYVRERKGRTRIVHGVHTRPKIRSRKPMKYLPGGVHPTHVDVSVLHFSNEKTSLTRYVKMSAKWSYTRLAHNQKEWHWSK